MLVSQKHVSERLILNSRRASISSAIDGAGDEGAAGAGGTDGGYSFGTSDPDSAAAKLHKKESGFLSSCADPPPPAPLDVIEIAWTPITKEVAATIVQVLVDDEDGKPPIRVVDLIDNRLGPKLTETICAAMEGSSVEELLFRFNEIGRTGCEAVASVVNLSTRLRFVDLRGNKLVPMDARKLFRSIAVSQSVQRLGLSNNNLGPEGAALLASALEKNSFVTQLDISMNNIGVNGVESLASILTLPAHPLRSLNVWGNRLGPQGTDVLLNAVSSNRSLTSLSAGNNNAGPTVGQRLAQLLQLNTTLTHLELRSNSFSSDVLSKLAEGVAQNSTLRSMQLGGNPLGGGGSVQHVGHAVDGFVKRLVKNGIIETLDLAGCELGTAGIIRLAGLIAASSSLRELCVSGNDAEDEAAGAIAKGLISSKSLTTLDLSANRFTTVGVTDILEAVQGNTCVLHCALQGNSEDVGRVVQEKVDAMLAMRRRGKTLQ